MKFIFFYSPIYRYYKDHITNNIGHIFNVEPILIDDLNKKDRNHWHTFCGGVSVKIELIIEKIKENMGDHIIFSDATIFINEKHREKLSNFFEQYKNYDISFADNTGYGFHYNIGLILIKCNETTLKFFNDVLIDLIANQSWDQYVVNMKITNTNTNLTIGCFDNSKIVCGDNFNTKYKEDYLIYKSFISHSDSLIVNYKSRFDKFLEANLINIEEYNNAMQYISDYDK
jgi:hypothetical protein